MVTEITKSLEYKIPKGPRVKSIREFNVDDTITVAQFDGDISEMDFIVKYIDTSKSKSLRTPTYMMIGLDLLLKSEQNPDLTKDFIIEFIQLWDNMIIPNNIAERDSYSFEFESILNQVQYSELNFYGELSTSFLTAVMYLYVLNERVKPNVKKFRVMLESVVKYIDREIELFSLVSKLK
jgi:hypothetical protein